MSASSAACIQCSSHLKLMYVSKRCHQYICAYLRLAAVQSVLPCFPAGFCWERNPSYPVAGSSAGCPGAGAAAACSTALCAACAPGFCARVPGADRLPYGPGHNLQEGAGRALPLLPPGLAGCAAGEVAGRHVWVASVALQPYNIWSCSPLHVAPGHAGWATGWATGLDGHPWSPSGTV